MADARLRARAYTREHGQDVPEISAWSWPYDRQGQWVGPADPGASSTGEHGGSGQQSAGGEDSQAASG
jgi:xylulose-5-phosphate/fructose-6-phosphate phosphoketolase